MKKQFIVHMDDGTMFVLQGDKLKRDFNYQTLEIYKNKDDLIFLGELEHVAAVEIRPAASSGFRFHI